MDTFENKQFENQITLGDRTILKKYEGRKRVINNIVLKINFQYLKNKDKLKYKDYTSPLGFSERIDSYVIIKLKA